MFRDDLSASATFLQGRVYVYQTSAVLYPAPLIRTDPLVRVPKGAPLDIVPAQPDTPKGWLAVQTVEGQTGYIPTETLLVTREHLLLERDTIQKSFQLAPPKIIMGGSILLFGLVATFGIYFASPERGFTLYSYGIMGAGAAELLWGLEQFSNVRRTLKAFDTFWASVLEPENHRRTIYP